MFSMLWPETSVFWNSLNSSGLAIYLKKGCLFSLGTGNSISLNNKTIIIHSRSVDTESYVTVKTQVEKIK